MFENEKLCNKQYNEPISFPLKWEDDAAISKYDRFDEPDPHADDYPMEKDDMPPSYEPLPAGSVLSVKNSAKVGLLNLLK